MKKMILKVIGRLAGPKYQCIRCAGYCALKSLYCAICADTGASLSQIAAEFGIEKGSTRKFLVSRGVDTSEGQRSRREDRSLDKEHKLRKIARYNPSDKCKCGCGRQPKAKGFARQCYINWYKREKRSQCKK